LERGDKRLKAVRGRGYVIEPIRVEKAFKATVSLRPSVCWAGVALVSGSDAKSLRSHTAVA